MNELWRKRPHRVKSNTQIKNNSRTYIYTRVRMFVYTHIHEVCPKEQRQAKMSIFQEKHANIYTILYIQYKGCGC